MTTASDNLETPVLLTQLLTLFPGALRALDSFAPARGNVRAAWSADVPALPRPGTGGRVAHSGAWPKEGHP